MKNPPEEIQITDIYACALLLLNSKTHKREFRGLDGKTTFVYDKNKETETITEAFREDITFRVTFKGLEIVIRPRSFARALQKLKTFLLH